MSLPPEQTIDARKYITDAPSLLWRIYDLVQADKVFEAEDLIYAVFREKEKDMLTHFREMLPEKRDVNAIDLKEGTGRLKESALKNQGFNTCLYHINAAIEKEEK